MSEVLEFAEDLARRAGVLIAEARADRALDLSYKEGIELLTSADLQSDQLIRSEIEQTFPDHYILSEESSPDFTDPAQLHGPLWIIDPIDGTVNYAYNQQQVAVSIAFAEGGQVQVGVVRCPFVDETFTARRGAGAYLNGHAIRTSECSELSRALIGTGFPYAAEGRVALVDRLRRVLGHCRDIRRVGSAAIDLCWVAMGRPRRLLRVAQALGLGGRSPDCAGSGHSRRAFTAGGGRVAGRIGRPRLGRRRAGNLRTIGRAATWNPNRRGTL